MALLSDTASTLPGTPQEPITTRFLIDNASAPPTGKCGCFAAAYFSEFTQVRAPRMPTRDPHTRSDFAPTDGKNSMRVPPFDPRGNKGERFHSLVDNFRQPSTFVITESTRAYPGMRSPALLHPLSSLTLSSQGISSRTGRAKNRLCLRSYPLQRHRGVWQPRPWLSACRRPRM
jgi:hypothetical protein